MEKFKYTAINLAKKKFSGTFLAENEEHLRKQLAEQNLFLVSCQVVTGKTPTAFFSVSSKVKISEITTFCRQFATMISSGITILESIDTLRNQSYTTLFRRVLDVVYEDIKAGDLLSEACKKHKRIFPEFFVSMVYVGEMSGSLDIILNSLADYYERDTRIRRKAKSAMSYPIVLCVLTAAIVLLLFIFIIPMFMDVLGDMGVEMPALTLAIFNISTFIIDNWKMLFLAVFALVGAFLLFRRTVFGREFLDMLKTQLPIIKNLTSCSIASRFARGFGVLLNSGMDVIDALDLMSGLLGNKYVEGRFKRAADEVRHGMKISEAMSKFNIFPLILTQMIAVGENTGSLDSVLQRSSGYFDEQYEGALLRMTGMLEPLMICIMGVVVAVVVISVYMPMLSMMTTLG